MVGDKAATRHLGSVEKIRKSRGWRWICRWIEAHQAEIAESKRCSVLSEKIRLLELQVDGLEKTIDSQCAKIESLERDVSDTDVQNERLRQQLALAQDELIYSAKIIARDRERVDAEASIFATIKTGHATNRKVGDIDRFKDEVIYGDE